MTNKCQLTRGGYYCIIILEYEKRVCKMNSKSSVKDESKKLTIITIGVSKASTVSSAPIHLGNSMHPILDFLLNTLTHYREDPRMKFIQLTLRQIQISLRKSTYLLWIMLWLINLNPRRLLRSLLLWLMFSFQERSITSCNQRILNNCKFLSQDLNLYNPTSHIISMLMSLKDWHRYE